jgi:hypothetical protein
VGGGDRGVTVLSAPLAGTPPYALLTISQPESASRRRSADDAVRQVLLALHPARGRRRGDGWARCLDQGTAIARWRGMACASPRFATSSSGKASRSPIPRAPLRGPRAAVWQDRHDESGSRWRAGPRAPARYWLGRLADAAPRQETSVSRVDLHRGALTALLRLSHVEERTARAIEACERPALRCERF